MYLIVLIPSFVYCSYNKQVSDRVGQIVKKMALTLPYPLTGDGSILKMDLICSINGSIDVLLFEYITCPHGDS